jgi:hypothetical protein
MLPRHSVLAGHSLPTGLAVMAGSRLPADADAVAYPDRAGSQHASQLAAFRQVKPLV